MNTSTGILAQQTFLDQYPIPDRHKSNQRKTKNARGKALHERDRSWRNMVESKPYPHVPLECVKGVLTMIPGKLAFPHFVSRRFFAPLYSSSNVSSYVVDAFKMSPSLSSSVAVGHLGFFCGRGLHTNSDWSTFL